MIKVEKTEDGRSVITAEAQHCWLVVNNSEEKKPLHWWINYYGYSLEPLIEEPKVGDILHSKLQEYEDAWEFEVVKVSNDSNLDWSRRVWIKHTYKKDS